MNYPAWAPQILVAEHKKQLETEPSQRTYVDLTPDEQIAHMAQYGIEINTDEVEEFREQWYRNCVLDFSG